jgi:hypothetical protein
MNMKVVLLVALTLVILGVPASFAIPQYVSSLNKEYGVSSCGTCHVDPNGGGARNAYGIQFQNQPNHASNPDAALIAIGAPPTTNPTVVATATLTPAATATMAPTPVVTMVTATVTSTPTQVVTTTATATPVPPAAATATPASPGFGIGLSLIGLFAWSLLAKRRNK